MPFPRPTGKSSRVAAKKRHVGGLLGAIALVLSVNACSNPYLLTGAERAAVAGGDKAIVLLRVKCTIDNQPYELFSHSIPMDNLGFGLGTFASAGEPAYASHHFLSEDSRQQGWAYFLLSPGIYYLTVRPPQRGDWKSYDKLLQTGPRWRIDIAERSKLIYVGTLSLKGEADALLFGGKIMRSIDDQDISVENEQTAASKLLAEHFPGLGEAQTCLMQRWHAGEPIIIRSPAKK